MREFNLQDLLISHKLTVKESMKKLDTVASKILFVVNEERALIGSFSDGDIRRYILNNGSLDADVETACNKNTFRLNSGFNKIEATTQMNELDILFAPVIDEVGIIINIFTVSGSPKIVDKAKYSILDIPVIIMAGGKGTRMEPFTNVLPKPLIPIGQKTMVEHIIDEYRKYGIDEYFLTINYKGNLIEAYFNGIEKEYKINYLRESLFQGTAASLKLLEKIPDTFIVSNCDIIVKADYSDVLKFHKESGSLLTMLSSIQHQTIPYGVVEFENGGRVKSIREKPEYSISVNTGVYILEREAWEFIPHNEFFHMTHLIEVLIKNNKKVMTYPVNENDYIDVGQWEEYKQAVSKFI